MTAPATTKSSSICWGDYKSNLTSYPRFQEYFRAYQPPILAVWGRNDPFFLPAGAEAFRRDLPNAEIRFADAGHFPLETHLDEVAGIIRAYLARTLDKAQWEALFGKLDAASVPLESKELLAGMGGLFGFRMLQALGKTSLDPIAQQVALGAASRANAAEYAIAGAGHSGKKVGASAEIVGAIRNGGSFSDVRLEAVRRFAAAIASKGTQVSDSDVHALTAAGYDRRAVVALALAAGTETLVNTVAHLSHVAINEGFQPEPAQRR